MKKRIRIIKEHVVDRNKEIKGILEQIRSNRSDQTLTWNKNLGSEGENRTKNNKCSNKTSDQKWGRRNIKAARQNKERIY